MIPMCILLLQRAGRVWGSKNKHKQNMKLGNWGLKTNMGKVTLG